MYIYIYIYSALRQPRVVEGRSVDPDAVDGAVGDRNACAAASQQINCMDVYVSYMCVYIYIYIYIQYNRRIIVGMYMYTTITK